MLEFFQKFFFVNPWWLLGLLLIPLLFFIGGKQGSRGAISFSSLGLFGSLGMVVKQRAGNLHFFLMLAALAFCFLTLARPQWRNSYTKKVSSGIEILLALDVSESMRIDDFVLRNMRRRVTRFDAAKLVIADFVKNRPADGFGLVIFSGLTYTLSPITPDHDWLLYRLNEAEMGSLNEPGTAIGSAIAASATRLTKRKAKSKIIVLVTDGASNSGRLDPVEAASLAKDLGIKVYTIAIGSEGGRLSSQQHLAPRMEFDEKTLRSIAKITGGEFFHARNLQDLRNTFDSINKLEKSEIGNQHLINAAELYPWFCGISALLALCALVYQSLAPRPLP